MDSGTPGAAHIDGIVRFPKIKRRSRSVDGAAVRGCLPKRVRLPVPSGAGPDGIMWSGTRLERW
jgi:hypothetical protein